MLDLSSWNIKNSGTLAVAGFLVKHDLTQAGEMAVDAGEPSVRRHTGKSDEPYGRGQTSAVTLADILPVRGLSSGSGRVLATQKRRPLSAADRGRVLVMDGHPMVEEWIGTLVGRGADILFAGHAADLEDAAALVCRGRPNIVLLEIAANIPRSLKVVRALNAKFPELRMLVFSSCDEIVNATKVLRAGAHGFVSKGASGPELLHAMREVLDERVYLSSAMINHLATGGVGPISGPPPVGAGAPLSQRELQVFAFIGEGLRPTEIAQRISLSVKTVESYLVRIREKRGLRDARALFQDAVKWSKAGGRAAEP